MLLTSRTVFLTLLAGALSGGATWWVGKFAIGRLLAIGHTTTDQSVGASVMSSMAMLGLMVLATVVTIALLVIAAVAKSAAVKGRFLRGGLVGVGFLTGALAAIYIGLYVLTTPTAAH